MKRAERELQAMVTDEVKRQLKVGYAVEVYGPTTEDVDKLAENYKELYKNVAKLEQVIFKVSVTFAILIGLLFSILIGLYFRFN